MARLAREYGSLPPPSRFDPLTELVLTVLSQNTSDRNSHPAFEALKRRFASWEEMAGASEVEIARPIRQGGLARIKASRLKAILQEIERRRGRPDLEFLRALPTAEARAWLRSLPGVGPKTAAVVLLFSLGKPALPVDTHVHRVAVRLGLLPPGTGREKAHELLEAIVPPAGFYPFHLYLLEHGRRICRARKPRCPLCPVNSICPSYGVFYPVVKREQVMERV
ncbi:MAG: endonuclease III [Chloroflexi bacterium]|nr:endonuclease III [Chloroflexota bacterium]